MILKFPGTTCTFGLCYFNGIILCEDEEEWFTPGLVPLKLTWYRLYLWHKSHAQNNSTSAQHFPHSPHILHISSEPHLLSSLSVCLSNPDVSSALMLTNKNLTAETSSKSVRSSACALIYPLDDNAGKSLKTCTDLHRRDVKQRDSCEPILI